MSVFQDLSLSYRRWYHRREIEASLRYYKQRTGRASHRRHRYAESGSFRSQVDRLFEVGSAVETDELVEIARSVVTVCIPNQFYRPADYLSDVIDALERHTFLGWEPEGEPPLGELSGPAREAKIDRIKEAWLVPLKVATIEELVGAFTQIVGGRLHAKARGRFERAIAELFSHVAQNELETAKDRVRRFLQAWRESDEIMLRYPQPTQGIQEVTATLTGESPLPAGSTTDQLQVKSAGQPLRLSTVVPQHRSELVNAAFARLQA